MNPKAQSKKSLLLLVIPILLGAVVAGLLSQDGRLARSLERVSFSDSKTAPVRERVMFDQVVAAKPTPLPRQVPLEITKEILFDVPFSAQAPFGDWADPRQQNACEEASALMAIHWARGTDFNRDQALEEIIKISDWEQEVYGVFEDTSAADTLTRIFQGYFGFDSARLQEDVDAEDIKQELRRGNLVVTPVNGQKLGNPFFTAPGPVEHMLVVIGYDPETNEFITNDPGTRHGEGFRYHEAVLENALRDYVTGYHVPISEVNKVMIVVEREA